MLFLSVQVKGTPTNTLYLYNTLLLLQSGEKVLLSEMYIHLLQVLQDGIAEEILSYNFNRCFLNVFYKLQQVLCDIFLSDNAVRCNSKRMLTNFSF